MNYNKIASLKNFKTFLPVIVELCPAAKIPTAQIYIAIAPKVQPKKIPPLYKSAST